MNHVKVHADARWKTDEAGVFPMCQRVMAKRLQPIPPKGQQLPGQHNFPINLRDGPIPWKEQQQHKWQRLFHL